MYTLSTILIAALAVSAPEVDFTKDVQPILQAHCLKCHGEEEQESSLRLDRRASLLQGGDYGEPAVVPGDAEKSFLIQVVSGKNEDLTMPPKGNPLSAAEIAVLSSWINQGAKMPEELAGGEGEIAGADHWSFQPVAEVPVPSSTSDFVAGPIDAFILKSLAEKELQPSSRADRRTLIRRLYFVMHGLPPTQQQIERFLADDSENAWQTLVEEVLASPRYGERWAQHWLDIIRFGETTGFETNRERPAAWPFRDYVIRSFNNDKPYDQFVREQIAGDSVDNPIGTGFLVAGPNDIVKGQDGALARIQRMNELDDMINTTGATFLGLSLGCARCHNHKFDPVTQLDYYAMQAIFAGVQHGDTALPPSAADQKKIASLEREVSDLTERLARFLPGAETNQEQRPAVRARGNTESFPPQQAKYVRFTIDQVNAGQPCIDELEIYSGEKNVALAAGGAIATASGSLKGYDIHKLEHIHDGKHGNSNSWICDQTQGWVQIELPEVVAIDRIAWARDREGAFGDRLAIGYRIECALEPGKWQEIASSRTRMPFKGGQPTEPAYDFTSFPQAEAEQGKAWLARLGATRSEIAQLQNATRAYCGTFSQPGATHRLYRGEPDQKREVVGPDAISFLTSLDLENNAPEKQRRLALANWIASEENPLTARVIVNRLWQFHFGEGLVDTPSDFGHNGTDPTHPQLLDWLAGELVAHDWSLKHIHRLMLSSNTWQQDSLPQKAGMASDSSGRFLWRFTPRRLEAEAIRDSMLAVSGALDLRMGGPGFDGFEIEPENVRHFFPKKNYGPEDWRRMVYMTKVRQEQESVFGAFDCPDASQVAPRRSRSTTPLQAFNLFNSKFVVQQSELFAERLEKESPEGGAARAALAYELAFGRPATADQATVAATFAAEHGWPALCRALFNANEFVFIP